MVIAAPGQSDVMPFSAAIEVMFRKVLDLENFLMRSGIMLPFGGSLLASASKP
jgi:hypothetical protein